MYLAHPCPFAFLAVLSNVYMNELNCSWTGLELLISTLHEPFYIFQKLFLFYFNIFLFFAYQLNPKNT
jgi:hypothetical protein